MSTQMSARALAIGIAFVLTSGYLAHASRPEQIPPRATFASFPLQIDDWAGQSAPAFEADVLQALGVDEYVNRYYVSSGQLAHLYIGYYQSQHQGSTIHSPMNCLPGAGWVPVTSAPLRLTLPGESPRSVEINRLTIQKGLDRQVVLYWYQSQGRTVRSEYWSKIYLVLDAIRMNRSDAALVRVVVPIDNRQFDGEDRATRAASDLAQKLFPVLGQYLPS